MMENGCGPRIAPWDTMWVTSFTVEEVPFQGHKLPISEILSPQNSSKQLCPFHIFEDENKNVILKPNKMHQLTYIKNKSLQLYTSTQQLFPTQVNVFLHRYQYLTVCFLLNPYFFVIFYPILVLSFSRPYIKQHERL